MSSKIVDTDHARGARRAPRLDRTVAGALDTADAAAAQGNYADALAWLGRLDALGYQLEPLYEKRREEWQSKVEPRRVGSSQWFG